MKLRFRSEILQQMSSYAASTVFTQVLALAAAFLTRRFLGPLQTGIWALLQIILNYATYSALGTTDALSREIPFYRGKNDEEHADRIKNVVSTYAFLASVIMALGVVVYAFWFKNNLRPEIFLGLLLTAGLVVLQRINNLLIALLRAYKKFDIASRQMVYSAFFNSIVVSIFAYKFRLYGFMWGMAVSFIFNILYVLFKGKFTFKLSFRWDVLKQAISYGFPLMLIALISTVFITVDKIMISKMLNLELLGFYSIAVLGYQYVAQIPLSMGTVLVPHFHEKYGTREDPKDLTGFVEKSSQGFILILTVLVACGWILTPTIIKMALPEFVAAIQSVQYLIFCAIFVALSQPYSTYLVAIKKHMLLFPIMGTSALVAILTNLWAIRGGYGISGVALATLFSHFYKFTLLFFISHHLGFLDKNAVQSYAKLMGQCLLLAVLLIGSELWVHPFANELGNEILRLIVVLGCFVRSLFNFIRSKIHFTLQEGTLK